MYIIYNKGLIARLKMGKKKKLAIGIVVIFIGYFFFEGIRITHLILDAEILIYRLYLNLA